MTSMPLTLIAASLSTFLVLPASSSANIRLLGTELKQVGFPENLEGVNLEKFCKVKKKFRDVELTGGTVYDWKCTTWNPATPYVDINMYEVCDYENPNATEVFGGYLKPEFSDINNPNSWVCMLYP